MSDRVWLFIAGVLVLIILLWNIPRNRASNPAVVTFDEAAYPGQFLVYYGYDYDPVTKQSRQTFFTMPNADSAEQPQWDPIQPLPKPMAELERAAYQGTFGDNPEVRKSWKVTHVNLQHFSKTWHAKDGPPSDRVNRWYCSLTFTNQDPGQYAYKTACVLLDGTVLEPKLLTSEPPATAK